MSQSKFLNYGLTFKPDSTALLINQMLPELGASKGPPSLFWKHTLDCGRVKSTTKSWVCFVGSNLNTSNWKDYSNQSNFTLCGKDSGSCMSGRVFARKLLAKLSGTSIYMPRCADSNDIESKSSTENLFHLFWRIKSSLTSKFKQQDPNTSNTKRWISFIYCVSIVSDSRLSDSARPKSNYGDSSG